jgi:hypothetical protein
MPTPHEIFNAEYQGGANFMTPEFVGLWDMGPDGAVELATGRGIEGDRIWGVTIAIRDPKTGKTTRDHSEGKKYSQLFHSRRRADRHIAGLRKHPPTFEEASGAADEDCGRGAA